METTTYKQLETLLNDLLQNDLDVKVAERKIEQAFPDSFINENITDDAYFQEFRSDIYLKDSNGLSISFISGKGDIYGDMHSYNGSTISLHDAHSNEIYELYSENEFQQQTVSDLVKDLPEILANRDDFISEWNMADPFYLYTIDKNELHKNPEIANSLLDKLWLEATIKHNSEYTDYMISPYGGEDVTVHPIPEHFLHLLDQFGSFPEIAEASNEYLISKPECQAYLNKAIEDLKKQICYVENKETYRVLNDLQIQADCIEYEHLYDNNRYAEIIANEKKEDILQYQKAVTALEALQDKKYTLFDKLKNLPKKEYEYLAERVQISRENLDDILKREQQVKQTHEELKAQFNNVQREIKTIMEENDLPKLRIDYPENLDDKFDRVMNHYSVNYKSNKATLEKYQSILNAGTKESMDINSGVKKNIEIAKEKQNKTKNVTEKNIKMNIKR